MQFNISYLQSSGFYEFMLPFLLVTAITYGVFNYVKSTNKGKFPLNNTSISIISVVIGLFATNNRSVRNMMFDWAPIVILLIILLFVYLLVQKIFEGKNEDNLPTVVMLILLLIAMNSYGISNFAKFFGTDGEEIAWTIGIGIFVVILWSSYKHKPSS